MISKEFIQYEETSSLIALGFKEPVIAHRKDGLNICLLEHPEVLLTDLSMILYQQAFRWFRDEYKINGEVNYLPNIEKYGSITSDMNIKPKDLSKNENFKRGLKVTNGYVKYDTHKEAELACLRKLIDLVNQNKDE